MKWISSYRWWILFLWILSSVIMNIVNKNLFQSYNVDCNSFPKLRISSVKAYIKISPCVLFIDRNTVTDRLRKSKLSIMYFNECLSSAALMLHLVNANIRCISLCIQFIFVPSRNSKPNNISYSWYTISKSWCIWFVQTCANWFYFYDIYW